MTHPTSHLTNDQIDDLLIGDAAAEAAAHLAACTSCTARFTAMQQPIASFNAASLAWGERRSATLPLELRPKPAGTFHGVRLRITLGAATAAVLALALALPLLHRGAATETTAQHRTPHTASTQPVQVATALPPATASVESDSTPDPQQIERDNRLLQAIDRELAASETPADLVRMTGQQNANQSSPGSTHNE